MHRTPIALAALATLFACKKEDSPAGITFRTVCTACEVTYGITGESSTTESFTLPVQDRVASTVVGREVFMRARATQVSNTGMGIIILVNGFQQDFAFLRPNSPALLDSTIELRLVVPALNRFGEPE
jgi:hypothetical protein